MKKPARKSRKGSKKSAKKKLARYAVSFVAAVGVYFFALTTKKIDADTIPNAVKTVAKNVAVSVEESSAGKLDAAASPLENTPLYLGNPSRAEKNDQNEENYLLEKKYYALSYNNKTYIPNWVAWHLSKSYLGETTRDRYFYADDSLPGNWYSIKHSDFQFAKYGFERGHMCPSADRTASREMNSETFFMTNMIPQAPNSNGIVWSDLEKYERKLAQAGNELYIFAGPAGKGGTSKVGTFEKIPLENGRGDILVPSHLWKIILVLPEGNGDLARIDKNTQVIAVLTPNTQDSSQNGSWQQYTVSVDDIELVTGFDFFSELEDELEEFLEKGGT